MLERIPWRKWIIGTLLIVVGAALVFFGFIFLMLAPLFLLWGLYELARAWKRRTHDDNS